MCVTVCGRGSVVKPLKFFADVESFCFFSSLVIAPPSVAPPSPDHPSPLEFSPLRLCAHDYQACCPCDVQPAPPSRLSRCFQGCDLKSVRPNLTLSSKRTGLLSVRTDGRTERGVGVRVLDGRHEKHWMLMNFKFHNPSRNILLQPDTLITSKIEASLSVLNSRCGGCGCNLEPSESIEEGFYIDLLTCTRLQTRAPAAFIQATCFSG